MIRRRRRRIKYINWCRRYIKYSKSNINFKELRKGTASFEDIYQYLTNNGFILKEILGYPTWQAITFFVK